MTDSTATNEEVQNAVRERGVTRLCHFTQSRNWLHIAGQQSGLLSTAALEQTLAPFTATDKARYDGHKEFLSCSIEYPNSYYLKVCENDERVFQDWVILLIDRKYLWRSTTEFCPHNAAKYSGKSIASGIDAFNALYAPKVEGFDRTSRHLKCCPTDQQAEALVKGQILVADIYGLVCRSREQAQNEQVRWRLAKISGINLKIYAAPQLFERRELASLIRSGQRPDEYFIAEVG